MWKKVKMPVTSIFSFFHNVFKRLLLKDRFKSGLCDKGFTKPYINIFLSIHIGYERALLTFLNAFKTLPPNKDFLYPCKRPILETLWEK